MAEIDDLIAGLNKKYKTDIIRKASDLKSVEFIPYSSPKMNYLTRGGVPVGRMIEYVGIPQSGKTTTALDVVAEFGETLLDMLLDYIRSGKVGLVVTDSAPVIQPKTTCEKALEDKSFGGNSALMKAFCDKAVPLCKKHECTFIMINQIRENIGNMYQPFKIPCGTALTHACSQIIWFTKGSLLDEKGNEVSGNYANPSGNVVSAKMHKNKVTKNDRRLDSYTLNYYRGVDAGADTVDLGIKLGIIVQTGAWFKVPVSDGTEKKLQGRAGLIDYFYNDLEEFEKFQQTVYEATME